ncbi:TetR/AcrR family transcriptional regulator [Ruania halotolerans]|uniref:TetR/AcrR family transcriptional regulator n=1 Tax=Ruania halotolerans TaxID=2897773 RepID=UPI001E520016|nr:TetR family transcriptional regulator [Ruania halotolerans]UFU05814.1 TetR family transcriptional regulator [Ruania halotolerans]
MTSKGERRRQAVLTAAVQVLLEQGPTALTHREVATRAGCSLSATTYYFASLSDLVTAAGTQIVARWAEQAERVADRLEAAAPQHTRISAAVEAVLPEPDQVRGHYEHLAGAGRSEAVAAAYAAGRARVDAAVERITGPIGLDAELVVAVIDGAAITALSEGQDPATLARDLLARTLVTVGG